MPGGARARLLLQREGRGTEAAHDLELSDAGRAGTGVRGTVLPRARASPRGPRHSPGDRRPRGDRVVMTRAMRRESHYASPELGCLLLLARGDLTVEEQS